jgi:cbb3-type cytochrome oxidase cytochrome c subunit
MTELQGTESPLRFIIVMSVIAIGVIIYFTVKSSEIRDGQTIFKEEGCVKCHVFHGMGMGIIDLTKVTKRRSDTWIRDQITDARIHDPGSGMPRFGFLSDDEINSLIEFLHTGPKK